MDIMDDRNDILEQEEEGQADGSALFGIGGLGTSAQWVQKYTHCVACGSNLHFSHLTDFNRNLTEESSRCPECGERSRRTLHRLQ